MKTMMLAGLLMMVASGCSTPFYSQVDGTTLNAGITLPNSADAMQLQVVSLLSGAKTTISGQCEIVHEFEHSATNSLLGITTSVEHRRSQLSVIPVHQE